MKSKTIKRNEALARAKSYSYDNSKAKRKGISEEEWKKANQQHTNKLMEV